MGLHQAGFEVVGVDIKPQPHYPFEFHQGDALQSLQQVLDGLSLRAGYLGIQSYYLVNDFDAYWASPPCQAWADFNSKGKKPSKHPRLIEPIRQLLQQTGKPYIIENVHKAPLKASLMLCGTMFGLRVIRHRYFELSFPAPMSPFTCNHWGTVASGEFLGIYARGGHGHRHGKGIRDVKPNQPKITRAEAMGISWMSNLELNQAIPPAYSRFIGEQLMKVLRPNPKVEGE